MACFPDADNYIRVGVKMKLEDINIISEKECLYARLAMAIDTDGSIGIRKNQRNYIQVIQFSNTNIKLIEWIVENFGGNIPNPQVFDNPKWKDVYHWQLHGSDSYKIIKKIKLYLIIKQEQADCTIELYEKVNKWCYYIMPRYKKNLANKLYERCKILNKRGMSEYGVEERIPKLKERKVVETLEKYV